MADEESSDRLSAINGDKFIDPAVMMQMQKKVDTVISEDQVKLRRIEDSWIRQQIEMLHQRFTEMSKYNVRKSNTLLIMTCVLHDYNEVTAEQIARSINTDLNSLMRPSEWMTLELFNRLVESVEELYGTPTAIYEIARRIHKMHCWGLVDALAKVAGSFGKPILGFKSVPSGNKGFNNTKEIELTQILVNAVMMLSRILAGIDPMRDIQSRFFVPGIICSIPHVWMMLAATFDELYLQFHPMPMLRYYQERSEKLGLGLPIKDPYLDKNGKLINNGQVYGQLVKVGYDDKGQFYIIDNSTDERDPVYIEKDIQLGNDQETGHPLYIIRAGQLTNMPYTLYEFKWQNPTWQQAARIFLKNSSALGTKVFESITSLSLSKIREVFTSPQKILEQEIEKEWQNLLADFDIYKKRIDEIRSMLEVLQERNEEDQKETLVAWTKEYEKIGGSTPGHVDRVTEIGLLLWDFIKSEVTSDQWVPRGTMEWALKLHDVGKIAIPENILKKPGDLTPAEVIIMQSHAWWSEHIMRILGYLDAAFGALHHEKMDGTGYVHGYKDEEIPLGARVVGIVDIFDALCTPREYKKAFSAEEALQILFSDAERNKIDKKLVTKFKLLFEFQRTFFEERYGQFWET